MEIQSLIADLDTRSIPAEYALDEDEPNEIFGRNNIAGFYADEEELTVLPNFADFAIEEIEEILTPYFHFYNNEEKDIIYLNLINGKTQTDLTKLFGKTQPALCSDVRRIKKEAQVIKVLKILSSMTLNFLADDELPITNQDRNLLTAFAYTMSIVKTSKVVGINSTLCRTRIEAAVKNIADLGNKRVYDYFCYILKHLNLIKKNLMEEIANSKPGKYDYSSGHISQEFNFGETK